jgi:hypothetical protein
MAIEFRCIQCQRMLRTADETAGRQAQCPECGSISPVPSSSEPISPVASPEGGNPFAAWQPPESQPASDNPYQSPAAPMHPVLVRADPSAVQRVAGPATALTVTAVLGLIQSGVLLVVMLLTASGALGPPGQDADDVVVAIVMIGVSFLGGFLILIGAMKMRKLESYGLAMTGAIVAMIPQLSPCCPLGLPFGIWALVVLSNGSVKAAFRK